MTHSNLPCHFKPVTTVSLFSIDACGLWFQHFARTKAVQRPLTNNEPVSAEASLPCEIMMTYMMLRKASVETPYSKHNYYSYLLGFSRACRPKTNSATSLTGVTSDDIIRSGVRVLLLCMLAHWKGSATLNGTEP